MTTGSGLAAVHLAAAAASTSLQPPPAAPAAPAATASAAASLATTVADLNAAYPDLCAALRADGAASERARILGIEAHAMQGHDALIAAMKADPAVTPDMAAGRILAAERAARGQHLQAIQDVEKTTGRVVATPASAPEAHSETASTPDGWKAEYAASPKLQGEFASADDYVSLKKAEAAGKVRVLGARK